MSEYVDGETLRASIARGAFAPGRARAIAVQVARALVAAHAAGVVHRDLKPENILITPAGDVKVVDFGIAHVEGSEATRLTRAGALLGTPAYMAPEQLLGGAVDGRADIYAFGVLLTEIYAASESPLPGISGESLARAVSDRGTAAGFVGDWQGLPQAIAHQARAGDVVIVMGAGSIAAVPARTVELMTKGGRA